MPSLDSNRTYANTVGPEETGRLEGGKNYLYAIAIDTYMHCPPLYNAVKDVQDVIDLLCEKYTFERANVITLFNEAATEANILHGLRDLARIITPKDNLVLYFSGHGVYDEILDEGYWVPVDAKEGAFEDYMPNSKVRTILNAIKSHHTFLIVDSCFSGSLFSTFRSSGIADRLGKDPSRWGLTSGRNEIVEDGKPGQNSPFASSLLYHLNRNEDMLGVAELCAKVVEDVTSNSNQTPRGEPLLVEGHRGGQFFFRPRQQQAKAVSPKKNSRQGSILYNVPNTMLLKQDTRCEVRVAFDQTQLKEAVEDLKGAVIKDIRVSDIMEVDLIDPSGSQVKPFVLRAITSKEQLVDPSDFTQWIFYVTPLKEGKFPLLLKVTVIEYLRGKERKREVVLEEQITVVATMEEPALEEVSQAPYKRAAYQFALSTTLPAKRTRAGARVERTRSGPTQPPPYAPAPPPPGRSRGNLRRILTGALSVLTLLILAFLFYPRLQQQSPEQTAELQARIDSARHYIALAERRARTEDPDYLEAYRLLEDARTFLDEEVELQDTIQQRQQQLTSRIREINERERLAVKSTEEGQPKPLPKTSELEEIAWARTRRINSAEAYQQYLQAFEEGKYTDLAKARLKELKQSEETSDVVPVRPKLPEDSDLPDKRVLTFTDIRDGRIYEAVNLDGQYWMLESLTYKTRGAYCYDMQADNCEKYGALYPWRIAQNACPKGWRLPTPREWNELRKNHSFEALIRIFPATGGMLLKENQSVGLKEEGYYWAMRNGGEPAIAIFRMDSREMEIQKARRGMAVYCRCVME